MNISLLRLKLTMLFATLCCVLGFSNAHAGDLVDISGTWNVKATETGVSNCPSIATAGKVSSYIWLIGTSPGGQITISVQGETAFPKLGGSFQGSDLTVVGHAVAGQNTTAANLANSSFIQAKVSQDGTTISGTRRFLGYGTAAPGVMVPCFLDMKLEGKKAL